MKWQEIANVTKQINETAKHYHDLKLQRDAAAEIPSIWSDFITETGRFMHNAQNHIEVDTDKNGGLAACLKFGEFDEDFEHNNSSLQSYVLTKHDNRAKEYLSKSRNPYTRKFLQEKLGSYKIDLSSKINNIEISLIDGKRHSMFIDNKEKLVKATYDNPDLYFEHVSQLAVSLDALPLMADKKDELLKATKRDLSEAASMGIIRESPQRFLEGCNELKDDLSLNSRIRLESKAESMMHQKRQMENARVKSLSHSHFASLLKNGKGIDGFMELASTALGEEAYFAIRQKEELYNKAYLISNQLKHAPFSQGAAILEEIKPSPGNVDYIEKEQLYNILQKQFKQQLNDAKADPAKFVEELFVGDIPEDISFSQRLLFRKQLQEQKAIPGHMQKYLMGAEKDEYARRLETLDVNEIKKQLDTIMAIGGEDDPVHYQIGLEILGEITRAGDLSIPVHFYAENHLYSNNNRTRRDLANCFAQIIGVQKQLFSSITSQEKRQFEEEIRNNKIFKEWEYSVKFQQPYNIENAELMQNGIRSLARFYQLSHGMRLDKSIAKATKQMIEDCYIQPRSGLYVPKEIIDTGVIHNLEEDYIKGSLNYLERSIMNGEVTYDYRSSFGIDFEEEYAKEKVNNSLKEGKWFLSPDRRSVYYAYQLGDGTYQSLMLNEMEKLKFDLLDLNEPETDKMRNERMMEEMEDIINLGHIRPYHIKP